MTTNGNRKKNEQLGISYGTACNRLRKMVLFDLIQRFGLDTCFRCGEKIETIEALSLEHKERWLDTDDPVGRFFNLDNIAFSHLTCNIKAQRRGQAPTKRHGCAARYRRGCRCDECRAWKSEDNKKRNISSTRGYQQFL